MEDLKAIAKEIRRDIVKSIGKAASGHPGGSLSAVEMLTLLYFEKMNVDPKNPTKADRDRFVLSKGHAAPALYAAFHQLGWVRDDELGTLRQLGTRLQGHPDRNALPGVEVCSGSLGQGLSIAAGAALGFLADAPEGAHPRHVFCVCGDGELQEGSNWEALMFAPNHGLSNLTMFLDLNNLQIDGDVRKVNSLGDVDAKLAAFGWHVIHTDGHDIERLHAAVEDALAFSAAPTAIAGDTIKGKGVSFMEDEAGWHGKAPNEEETALALADLDAERAQIEKEA